MPNYVSELYRDKICGWKEFFFFVTVRNRQKNRGEGRHGDVMSMNVFQGRRRTGGIQNGFKTVEESDWIMTNYLSLSLGIEQENDNCISLQDDDVDDERDCVSFSVIYRYNGATILGMDTGRIDRNEVIGVRVFKSFFFSIRHTLSYNRSTK